MLSPIYTNYIHTYMAETCIVQSVNTPVKKMPDYLANDLWSLYQEYIDIFCTDVLFLQLLRTCSMLATQQSECMSCYLYSTIVGCVYTFIIYWKLLMNSSKGLLKQQWWHTLQLWCYCLTTTKPLISDFYQFLLNISNNGINTLYYSDHCALITTVDLTVIHNNHE